jgi:choline dehydrogenase
MSTVGFDYIVVGAGSAGAIVASRLSEDPGANVLLLEAGPDYPDFEKLPDELKFGYASASYVVTHGHLWSFVGRANRTQAPTAVPRGKVTGGTGAVNGQVFLRGLRSDFDDWAAIGNDLWSFESVLPSFRKLEKDLDFQNEWHGNDGPIEVRRYQTDEMLPPQLAFVQACLDAGYGQAPDANEPGARGISPIPFNNVGGIRLSTALAYLAPARVRKNLVIRADVHARRVAIRNGRAVGVEIADSAGGTEFVYAADVLICCGSIGSPHILLLSGIGPAEELRHVGVEPLVDRPGVGKHLQDHHVADMLWYTVPAYGIPPANSPRTQVALRYTAAHTSFPDDMQITPRTHPPQPGPKGRDEPVGVVSIVPAIERAVGSGEVRLRSADPTALPEIDFHFLEEPTDLARIREGVRIALELTSHREFASILARRLAPSDEEVKTEAGIDAWLLRSVRTSHHSCGTCKMGPPSDPQAVVDQAGRVYGVDGLRVIDASIFPEVVRANTAATTMAVAERLVEMIRAGG